MEWLEGERQERAARSALTCGPIAAADAFTERKTYCVVRGIRRSLDAACRPWTPCGRTSLQLVRLRLFTN
jgi:hypothetical protein